MTKWIFWRVGRVGLILFAVFLSSGVNAETVAHHGMVVTAQHLASDVGLQILREGGNAIDAAVAVGYAEAVVNPCCGNIGGGGFMLIHLKGGRNTVINFRETAPHGASAAMYEDSAGALVTDASLFGYKAVATPGTVRGLDEALREYGHLSRAHVLAPAIRLARDGFILTTGDADIFAAQASRFRADLQLVRLFLRPDGSPLQAGDKLVQSDLAKTISGVSKKGADYFYRGAAADAIATASAAHGGVLSLKDLSDYRSDEAEPLRCIYRGYEVVSIPPPSSGGVSLCEILNILEGYDLKKLGFHSAAATRLLIEAMRQSYIDRNGSLGDPKFVVNPLDRLLSKQYAATIRKAIGDGAIPIAEKDSSAEKPQTTHYSIVDREGNAVSVTYTLNGSFGAQVIAPGTGVLLNDEMDDFTTKPGIANQFGLAQGTSNAISPGKQPLSSMSPTILLRDGRPVLVLGRPGGSRIITATLEAVINIVDYEMTPQRAVDAPRIHFQAQPNTVFLEAGALSKDVRGELESQGYKFEEQAPWCAVELIEIGQGQFVGANDYRRPAGSAAGY